MPPEHFQGMSVAQHLKEARKKGAYASREMHGSELPGHLSAGADSAKEMAIALIFLWALQIPLAFLALFALGWMIWKGGRSAIGGWAKLERLHLVIEEERWEIEHHREQEKQELRELYQAKGFHGKLLDEAVEVMMADDNRLLKIMLEEELGLTLEIYEHPLKQAFGAALGCLIAALFALLGHFLWPEAGLPIMALVIVCLSSYYSARFERRSKVPSIVWNLSLTLFCAASLYFLVKLL